MSGSKDENIMKLTKRMLIMEKLYIRYRFINCFYYFYKGCQLDLYDELLELGDMLRDKYTNKYCTWTQLGLLRSPGVGRVAYIY